MVLLVNQHTVPVFIDVANAFASAGVETRLFAGHVEQGRVPLATGVEKIGSIRYNRGSTFRRFATWMSFSVHYFFYLLFCKKPTCVLVTTNPPMAPFITAVCSAIRGIKFHVVVFDLYPEAIQQAGLASERDRLYRMWQRNNRWTFARAHGLITLSASLKQAVARYVDPAKVSIIFNWADADYVKPIAKNNNPFISKHRLDKKFVVMYSGNMGLTHDLESILDAAKILVSEKGIQFVLIGEGGKRRKLESMKEQMRLDNVTFLPFQDAATFPLAMAAADVGIITLGTGAEGISVPSKTYVNMAAGLALITISPADSELNRIVHQFSLGYAVLPGEPQRIAQIIRSLAANAGDLAAFKQRSRAAALNFTSANATAYVNLVLGR